MQEMLLRLTESCKNVSVVDKDDTEQKRSCAMMVLHQFYHWLCLTGCGTSEGLSEQTGVAQNT